jgi:Na+-translocating ferredoxin:NAD+ oxidoreductase subunit G
LATCSRLAAVAALLGLSATAGAKVFLTQEEAVKLAFPGAAVERKAFFLTQPEQKEVEKLSGGPASSALAVAYVAVRDGKAAGTAYFDTHVVRTQQEFQGRKLDDELAISRGIRAVSGATLTARATTEAARRVLALHAVLARRQTRAA